MIRQSFAKIALIVLCWICAQTSEFSQEYILDGGGKVIVYKPYGAEYYTAVVTMDGEYPGLGMIAHDVGRSEFIYVLDGKFEIQINERLFCIQAGEDILIHAGDFYSISGKGRCMVFIHDQPGGCTEIRSR